jgi:hypothetical protein
MKEKSLLLLFFIAVLFSGCSKYGYVWLDYPLDPSIVLPDHVKQIAVVNRSLTKDANEKNKVVESIFSGEIAGSDRLASDECLKGVYDQLNGKRGYFVIIPQKTRLYGTGTRETPELLDWKLVQAICDSNQANALLVLENFDANTDLLLSTVTKQVANIMNGGKPGPVLPDQVRMNVMSYWRMYDPSSKTIIDQYQGSISQVFNCVSPGNSILSPGVLEKTAFGAGQEYLQRFLPSYYTVQRNLYKRGHGNNKQKFTSAFRQTEVANWQEAINIWTAIANQSTGDDAGRACLNIAVGYEVLGNTEEALKWAKKSYTDYNNQLGKEYSNILMNRRKIEY